MSRRSRQKRAAQRALATPQPTAEPAALAEARHLVAAKAQLREHIDYYSRHWYDSARFFPHDFDRGGYPLFSGYGHPHGYGDRRHDRTNSPLPYLTEQEYFAGVALSRDLVACNDLAIGFRDRVREFVGPVAVSFVLAGQDPGASAGDAGDVDPLVRECTQAWEEFCKLNDWGRGAEDREEEAVNRRLVEGEVTLRLFRGGRGEVPRVRFVEPEFIRCPQDRAGEREYSYGVETPPGDAETVLRIWIQEDPDDPTDVVPVESDRFVRAKGNVDRAIKRGLPDFFPSSASLRNTADLLAHMGMVADTQAKIPWVEKHAPASTDAQVRAMIEAGKDYSGVKYTPYGGTSAAPVKTYLPGETLHINNGRDLVPGPTVSPEGFLAIVGAAMRRISFRFGLPPNFSWEGADSFAGVLVAGSPFVKAITGRQKRQQGFTEALVERVLLLCEESGRLPRGASQRVRPVCDSEPVVVADEEKQARTKLAYFDKGLYDPHRIMRENGDDPKIVYANRAAHDKQTGGGQQPPGGGGGNPFDGPPPGPTPAPPGSAGGDQSSGADWLFGESKKVKEGGEGSPPFPGAVFDRGKHRWVNPNKGKGIAAGEDPDPAAMPEADLRALAAELGVPHRGAPTGRVRRAVAAALDARRQARGEDGRPREEVASQLAAEVRAMDGGNPDPRGYGSGPPEGLDLGEFARDLAGVLEEAGGNGLPVEAAHAALAEEYPGMSLGDFQRAAFQLFDDRRGVRPGAEPYGIDHTGHTDEHLRALIPYGTKLIGRLFAAPLGESRGSSPGSGGFGESVLAEAFTGTVRDSLGREVHFVDGKRVAAGDSGGEAKARAAGPGGFGRAAAGPESIPGKLAAAAAARHSQALAKLKAGEIDAAEARRRVSAATDAAMSAMHSQLKLRVGALRQDAAELHGADALESPEWRQLEQTAALWRDSIHDDFQSLHDETLAALDAFEESGAFPAGARARLGEWADAIHKDGRDMLAALVKGFQKFQAARGAKPVGEGVLKEGEGGEGSPPFPGAVFDRSKHRWVNPNKGKGGAAKKGGAPAPTGTAAGRSSIHLDDVNLGSDHFRESHPHASPKALGDKAVSGHPSRHLPDQTRPPVPDAETAKHLHGYSWGYDGPLNKALRETGAPPPGPFGGDETAASLRAELSKEAADLLEFVGVNSISDGMDALDSAPEGAWGELVAKFGADGKPPTPQELKQRWLKAVANVGGKPHRDGPAMFAAMRELFAKAEPFDPPVTVTRMIDVPPEVRDRIVGAARKAQESGGTLTMPGFVSTTTDEEPAFVGNVQFVIEARHGIDMKPYSHFPDENELLLNHNCGYTVEGVEARGRDDVVIKLRQVNGGQGGGDELK